MCAEQADHLPMLMPAIRVIYEPTTGVGSMVLLKRCLIVLLLVVLAFQLVTLARAWRDDAVAASWIEALQGENTCGPPFTFEETRHYEQLAAMHESKLTASERSKTDCYVRDRQRRQSLDLMSRKSTEAKRSVSDATILIAATAVLIIILAGIGRLHWWRAA